MLNDILFSSRTLQTSKNALEVYSDRERVHARNIANAETPGYRSQQVRFEEDLQLALRTSSEGHLATTDPRHVGGGNQLPHGTVEYRKPASEWNTNGVNDVDIDREMADVAQNTMRFTVTAEMVRQAYQGLRKAIHGRPV
ncbi:flagellar basal body rod protein FlgB [bacterium]|nr:flagellar basal body rod protein FlgB [bacterium]